jgi:dipeptidyl aminopeptidase/acylaminoacyl peptidase
MTLRQRRRAFLVAVAGITGVFAAGSLGVGAQTAAKRALTIEDYYRVQSVGGPQFSPDSRWILFSVTTRVEAEQGTRSESYVVATDGAASPRRIQHDGSDVTGAAWTSAGRLRYAAAGNQWTIDPANPSAAPERGEAQPAAGGRGTGRGGAGGGGGRGGRGGGGDGGGSTPSPDGKSTIVLRDKQETRPAPRTLSDFERRHEERFKGVTFDWMEFQRDGQPFPAPNPNLRAAQQVVLQAADGSAQPRILVDSDLRPANIAWRPDGKLIAFVADPDWRDEIKYESPDLWTVSPDDGRVTRLTDDGYVYSDVEFSPDGRFLSYLRSFGTDMIIQQKLNHGGSRDLFVRSGDLKQEINLTAKWDLDPGDSRWSPDGRYLYFTAGIGGETHLFRVAAPGSASSTNGSNGAVEQITKGERRINALSYNRELTKIAYTVGVHDSPGDVYVANIDGSGERRLSNVHSAFLKEVALGPTERVRWKSYDGTPIEGWLTFPYNYDRARGPYPLVVFSHGGPHSATGYSFDFKKQFFAANGYFVLDTNFRSSTGYGDAFKWATWGAWGDKDGQDVMSGIDAVIKSHPIDPKRVGHTGHSYGGFMTNWLITQYPDRFAAAITGAGISNWISDYGTADIFRTKETEFFGTPWDEAARNRMIKQSPLTYAGRVKTPTLFVHGEVDQRVPYEEAEQMYFALKRRGVPAKMIRYAGMPHGISGHWNNVHRMLNELWWWDTYLKGPAK